MDTMVLDNDDALKRHGVEPTYKKVKGFHPLQLNWDRYFVDAVFRGGKKHSRFLIVSAFLLDRRQIIPSDLTS